MGPFSVYNQSFGMIETEEGRVFEEIPVEGILGLAFPAMAANGIRPFVDGIIENKAIARNEFAFYFGPEVAGNAIFWGGVGSSSRVVSVATEVDKAFYTGEIERGSQLTELWSGCLEVFPGGGAVLLGGGKPR